MEEMVEIPRSTYERLAKAEAFLDCLIAAGVDNWDGYCDAQVMLEEGDE